MPIALVRLIELLFMGTTFAAVRAHAASWELAAVHLKLETNAKEVEKGFSRIEGRSGQINDQSKDIESSLC